MWSQQWSALWRLALPLMAVQAGNQLRSFVDTVIIGRLSAEDLGGVGLANAVFLAISILGMGVTMGLDPMIAQAQGAGRLARTRSLLWQGFWMALLLSPPLGLLVYLAPSVFVPAGIEPKVAQIADAYLGIRAWELLPVLIFYVARSYLQALGRTRPLVLAIVVSNLANLGLTLLLVHGGSSLPAWTGPLRAVPAMGVEGSAIATVLCVLLQLVVVLLGVRAAAPALDPEEEPPSWRASAQDLRQMLRVGGSIGLQLSVEVGIFSLMGVLAGTFGSVALAAHKVALTLASMSFTASLGIGSAGAVLVGRAIGAGEPRRATVAGWVSMLATGGWMSCSAALFWALPGPLTALVTDVPEVVQLAAPLLGLAAVFQLSDGFQAVGSGILRGAGDTHFSFVTNVIGHYFIGLPVALWCAWRAGMGVFGLWWGLVAGLSVVAVALALRFRALSTRGFPTL